MQLIEFHCREDFLDILPHPQPAMRSLPQWLRKVPPMGSAKGPITPGSSAEPSNSTIGSVKNCRPFIDAMGFGYLIPLPADMTFTMEPGNLRVEIVGFDAPLVDFHGGEEVHGAPFERMPIVKFHTPWLIKTPPGYSTLVLPPLNRFEIPFIPLAGVVETDSYYRQIAYPSLCTLSVGEQVVLKKGTPLVQVIPMLRQDWSSTIRGSNTDENAAQHRHWEQNSHMYRDQHWQKKSFR